MTQHGLALAHPFTDNAGGGFAGELIEEFLFLHRGAKVHASCSDGKVVMGMREK